MGPPPSAAAQGRSARGREDDRSVRPWSAELATIRLATLASLLVAAFGCVDLATPRELPTGDGAVPGEAGPRPEAGAPDGPAPVDQDGDPPDGPDDDGLPEDLGSDDDGADEGPPPKLATGQPCLTSEACASGVCADGVCCGGPCPGACQACNVAGAEGTCSPVPAGTDPGDECAEQPVAGCGLDGTCDGRGACRRYQPGTECGPGSCTGSTEFAASTCNAAGSCVAGSSRPCPGGCLMNVCGAACTSHGQCQAGFYCSGTCALKKGTGASCASGAECSSTFCADGVCCSSQCGQSCHSCNLSGSAGTCRPIPSGQDPGNECPAQAASSCGRLGGCNGAGACRLHPVGTECLAASCSAATEFSRRTCDGLGACQAGTTRACAPYQCGASACRTSCGSPADCTAGLSCNAGVCVPSGLVLRWRFDEASGSTAQDSSGLGHHGTYTGEVGAPTTSSNRPPTSFANPASRSFDMSRRQGVAIRPTPASLRTSGGFSVSVWFRTSGVDSIGSDVFNLSGGYTIRLKSSTIEWVKHATEIDGMRYDVCLTTGSGHLNGDWHHAAGVSDGDELRFYLDGNLRCSKDSRNNPIFDLAEFWVGRNAADATTLDFGGNIDDLRVYHRVLSAAEIAALAAGGD